MELKDRIRQILASREKRYVNSDRLVKSAVLLPIYERDQEYHVVLTKRTHELPSHKGQTCFPGGAMNKDDLSLLDTALRESYEEIGLNPHDVDVVGELDDTVTLVTNYIISPFVGFIPYPLEFTLNEAEVECLIDVPLDILTDEESFREETQVLHGISYVTQFYEYDGDIIWGATARILKGFMDLILKED